MKTYWPALFHRAATKTNVSKIKRCGSVPKITQIGSLLLKMRAMKLTQWPHFYGKPADISIKYNIIKYKYNNLFTVYTIILISTINAIIQQHNTTLFLHFTCTISSAD